MNLSLVVNMVVNMVSCYFLILTSKSNREVSGLVNKIIFSFVVLIKAEGIM